MTYSLLIPSSDFPGGSSLINAVRFVLYFFYHLFQAVEKVLILLTQSIGGFGVIYILYE